MVDEVWRRKVFVEIGGHSHSYLCDSRVSFKDSERRGYIAALKDGWTPGPLREKWWQVWRPAFYRPALNAALSTQQMEPSR